MPDALPSPVAVVGGAGRTGSLVVRRLLDAGVETRVVSRHARTAPRVAGSGASTWTADVRDGSGLDEALDGVRAVVFTIEPGSADSGPDSPRTTMDDGVRHVLARVDPDLARFVLVSQIYVTRHLHPMNRYGGLLDHRRAGERAVAASGLPYTVVRASWLTDDSGGTAGLRFEQGDTGDGQVTRSDLAATCVAALTEPAAAGTTFELFNRPGAAAADWASLFGGLAPDRVRAA